MVYEHSWGPVDAGLIFDGPFPCGIDWLPDAFWDAASSSVSRWTVTSSTDEPVLAASISVFKQSVDRSSRSAIAGVTAFCPLRSRSSSVSILWVNCATALNPNMPLVPLMEWAERNILLSRSRSSGCCSNASSPSSTTARCSAASSKKASWNCAKSLLIQPR